VGVLDRHRRPALLRIFNPVLQGRRYDAAGDYVRRWVPEPAALAARWIHQPWRAPAAILERAKVRLGSSYPAPIVDHAAQRRRAIAMYRAAMPFRRSGPGRRR